MRHSVITILALLWSASGSDALQAPPAAPQKLVLDLGGGVTMEFVLIKAGKFTMGVDDAGEGPPHEVTISKNFWMQTTETTPAQWDAVMGANRSEFKGADLPVEMITWDACIEFGMKLTEKYKESLQGKKAGLPTEAEWEYACRAGEKGKWCFGDDEKLGNDYAWHDGNSEGKSHPVGQKKPIAWGLYDIHGNIWEWCVDWHKELYPSAAVTDPPGPTEGDGRIVRGGCFDYKMGAARSTNRDWKNQDYYSKYVGVRPVLR